MTPEIRPKTEEEFCAFLKEILAILDKVEPKQGEPSHE
jgi:hypothetical protein